MNWTLTSESLPPIHEDHNDERGFVLLLMVCKDWPTQYKTIKGSRSIGDWDDDGAPIWFWTDEDGEIIDDDDGLIKAWCPIMVDEQLLKKLLEQ